MTDNFNLIPQPVSVTAGSGVFKLTNDTPLVCGDGCDKAAAFAARLFLSLIHM